MIASFYSKGRKEYVPLLSVELARRAGVQPHQATRWLLDALTEGNVQRVVVRNSPHPETIWSLTSKGKALADGVRG